MTYREAAEMLNLSTRELKWYVETGQLFEITIRGKRRIDQRDIVRLKRFLERARQWNMNHGQKVPVAAEA